MALKLSVKRRSSQLLPLTSDLGPRTSVFYLLYRFIAASTPSEMIVSTAFAARETAS
jgi:hypothetical protein